MVKLKIALLVRSLEFGGAERQLLAAAKGLTEIGHAVNVLSFYDKWAPLSLGTTPDIRHWSAHKRGRWDMVGFVMRMTTKLRELQPDVVYSSMPAANILVSVLRKIIGNPRLVWRLAASDMDLSKYDWFTRMSYRVESYLSNVPDAIVANSRAGRQAALDRGYPADKLTVIVNGIDTRTFFRCPSRGSEFLRDLGIEEDAWIIGHVARIDPKKDYQTFIEAAALLCSRRNDVQFVCVYVGSEDSVAALKATAHSLGLSDEIAWCPPQADMAMVYSALDINTLASAFGEGFPNTVAEAMSCGVPCVVTDVGDSALIVGDTGEVVAPRAPELLMDGWERLLKRLQREGDALRAAARARVVQNFGMKAYIERTATLLASVV